MKDWKLILNVVLGCAVLILVVIFGLSKMAGISTPLSADSAVLVNGAKLVKENGETKVTVVIFSDLECPACKRAHEQMTSLNNAPGVKMIFRYFPLRMHKYGLISAKAVEAARIMGKGWEMMDLLFTKQSEWSIDQKIEDVLVKYAQGLGLDEKVFLETLNSVEVASAIQLDMTLGNSLRLSGTPTIYVNGEQVASDFVVSRVNEILMNK